MHTHTYAYTYIIINSHMMDAYMHVSVCICISLCVYFFVHDMCFCLVCTRFLPAYAYDDLLSAT